MARRVNPAIELGTKRALVSAVLHGRESASSSSLSNSYNLDIEQVRALMRVNGVRDDG